MKPRGDIFQIYALGRLSKSEIPSSGDGLRGGRVFSHSAWNRVLGNPQPVPRDERDFICSRWGSLPLGLTLCRMKWGRFWHGLNIGDAAPWTTRF
jgi:hypothetical protein